MGLVAGAAVLGLIVVWRVRAGHSYVSSGSTAAELEPHVAAGPGVLGIAWMGVAHPGEHEAADRIGARVSTDGGKTWGSLEELHSLDGRYAADPVLVAQPDATLALTWLGFRANLKAGGEPYDMEVYVARTSRGDKGTPHFEAPIAVAGAQPGAMYDKPWAARTSRGALAVAYRFSVGAKNGVALVRLEDKQPPLRRTVAEGDSFAGSLATLCAAVDRPRLWIPSFDPMGGIVLYRSDDEGDSWPEAARVRVSLASEAVAAEAPLCLSGGDDLWIAYGLAARPLDTGSSALMSSLVLVHSRDGGASFDARHEVREEGALLMHPQIVREPSGALDAVYYAGRDEGKTGGLRSTRLDAQGARAASRTVGAPLPFVAQRSDPRWAGDYFGIAWSDRLVVAYGDASRGEPHVAFTTLP
jgi:hypothetical protein